MPVDIVGLGVDMCEIDRMERALARHPTMGERVFTPEERAYCDSKARPAESSYCDGKASRAQCYAARWAARVPTPR